jgi:hypothetical protein
MKNEIIREITFEITTYKNQKGSFHIPGSISTIMDINDNSFINLKIKTIDGKHLLFKGHKKPTSGCEIVSISGVEKGQRVLVSISK